MILYNVYNDIVFNLIKMIMIYVNFILFESERFLRFDKFIELG